GFAASGHADAAWSRISGFSISGPASTVAEAKFRRGMGKMVLMPPNLSRPFAPGLKGCMRNCSSSRLAFCDLVAGRGLHVVGVHRGLAMHQVLNQLADLGVIRMGVTFGVLFSFPKAERQDPFSTGKEDNLIAKPVFAFNVENIFSCSVPQTSLAF